MAGGALQRWNESDEERRADILLGVRRHPSGRVMAKNVSEAHELWLSTPGKKGQSHKDNTNLSAVGIFHRIATDGI
jgi:hypothetical protein